MAFPSSAYLLHAAKNLLYIERFLPKKLLMGIASHPNGAFSGNLQLLLAVQAFGVTTLVKNGVI